MQQLDKRVTSTGALEPNHSLETSTMRSPITTDHTLIAYTQNIVY